MNQHHWRRLAATGGPLLALMAAGATALESARASPGAGFQPVQAGRALRATDTAALHYVSASGPLLFEEGRASGTLAGKMKVHLALSSTLMGSFTIYLHSGSIKGHGEGVPHGSGVYESFAGWLVVTGGTGRYRHARGRARLYGTFNRNTYALLVQTTGTLGF